MTRPPPLSWRDAIFLTQLIHQANGKLSFLPNSPFTLSQKSFRSSLACFTLYTEIDQGLLKSFEKSWFGF